MSGEQIVKNDTDWREIHMKRDTVEVTVKQTETPFRPTGIILPNICYNQELYFSISFSFLVAKDKQRVIRLSEEQSKEI